MGFNSAFKGLIERHKSLKPNRKKDSTFYTAAISTARIFI
jgi:hypothetical protein